MASLAVVLAIDVRRSSRSRSAPAHRASGRRRSSGRRWILVFCQVEADEVARGPRCRRHWIPAHLPMDQARPRERSASFELYECTLPVRALRHSYTLVPDAGGTVVRQRMEYRLKFGPLGKLLDALVVRRKWDAGVRGFFAGL